MKFAPSLLVLALSLFINVHFCEAQEMSFTETYKKNAVLRLCELMNDFYVFPDVAKQTETHLLKQLNEGHFKQFTNDEDFAAALTESVQFVNKDKHMRIRKNRPYVEPENSPQRMIEEKIDRIHRSRRGNLGFSTVEMLEGNVGYLDLRGFAGLERGKAKTDSYMKLMDEADAIIIDLSKNGGGSPHMVQYLCSYFFDKKVHLNSLYWREGDETTEFWTLEEVGGEKMPDVPLFVITSPKTFSAAEEFSYNMQTQKRATIIGKTSGGGANPGGTRAVNQNLSVFIPSGTAINPVTKTNWEGVGVVPEIKTSTDEAKEKAHELAKEAAEKFRQAHNKKLREMLTSLTRDLDALNKGDNVQSIINQIKHCQKANLLGEDDINTLGYDYFIKYQKLYAAEIIFRTNTEINPESANVHDSYGEMLAEMGRLDEALISYQKAVEVAVRTQDYDLEIFRENLAKFKKRAEK